MVCVRHFRHPISTRLNEFGLTQYWAKPGSYTLVCEIAYRGASGKPNPPGPDTVRKAVTILGVKFVLISGTGTAAPYGANGGINLEFEVLQTDGKTIGPYYTFSIQEHIFNAKQRDASGNPMSTNYDSGWIPDANTPAAETLYLEYEHVDYTLYLIDTKTYQTPNPGAAGAFMYSYTQCLRVIWSDNANTQKISGYTCFDLTYTAVDNSNFKMSQSNVSYPQ